MDKWVSKLLIVGLARYKISIEIVFHAAFNTTS